MMVRTTDADEAAASDLVDGGRRESSAGGASGGGPRLRMRLPPRGVREWRRARNWEVG